MVQLKQIMRHSLIQVVNLNQPVSTLLEFEVLRNLSGVDQWICACKIYS